MASGLAFIEYTGDGSTTDFAFAFPYLDAAHMFLSVNSVNVTYTLPSAQVLRADMAPASGTTVRVYRVTPSSVPLVDFQDGSTLDEGDLDLTTTQMLYVTQEAKDTAGEASTVSAQAAADAAANSASYAAEWSNKAEDNLVSVAAGGDNVDDYSALHHANKAAASNTAAAAEVVNAQAEVTNCQTEVTNAQTEVTYAGEWANKAEDSLISVAAGGDNVDDYSAKHFANKAAASAAAVKDIRISSRNASHTIATTEHNTLFVIDPAMTVSMTLPGAAAAGSEFTVGFLAVDVDFPIQIDGAGSEIVDLDQTYDLIIAGHTVWFTSDGVSKWYKISESRPVIEVRKTASGAYTIPRPKGVRWLLEGGAQGAGGGGGRGSVNGAAGGSGGGTAIRRNVDWSAQASITGSVGAFGAGSGGNGAGSDGGNTTMVIGATTHTGPGGNGGEGNAAGANDGGDGPIGTNGDINIRGGAGENTWSADRGGGGGDSSWSGGTRGTATADPADAELGAGGGGSITGTSGRGGVGIAWARY